MVVCLGDKLTDAICKQLGDILSPVVRILQVPSGAKLYDFAKSQAHHSKLVLVVDSHVASLVNKLSILAQADNTEIIWIYHQADMSDIPKSWFGISSTSKLRLKHVVGHSPKTPHGTLAAELAHTAKLIFDPSQRAAFSADLFHNSYPDSGCTSYRSWLTSTDDITTIAWSIKNSVVAAGISSHWSVKISSAARELLSNALYDATCKSGLTEYGLVNKKNRLILRPAHWSLVRWRWDGDVFSLCIEDPFGLLDHSSFVDHIAKAQKAGEKNQLIEIKDQGGAGLGLFHVFLAASSLMSYQQPGIKTVVVALFKPLNEKHYFQLKPRSFHFFSS